MSSGGRARGIVLKNAVANVVNGGSGALLAVVLPPFLIRHLSQDAYSVWVLVLQLGAYTNLLAFGIQVAVGRYVAHAKELGDTTQRDRILGTAILALSGSALLAVLAFGIGAQYLPQLFPKIPITFLGDAKICLLWVGGSLALGLPFLAFAGYFMGLQRYEVPAGISLVARSLTAIGVVLAVRHGEGLVGMGKAFAIGNLISYALQAIAFQMIRRREGGHLARPTWGTARELAGYCYSLVVWNLAMVMISGLDIIIVAWLDFRSVGPYTVAAAIVAFMGGAQNALFGVLVPVSAVLGAQNDETRLGTMLVRATRYSVWILLAMGLPLWLAASPLLRAYAGASFGPQTVWLLRVLVLANMIRLTATPYAVILLGTGQQRLMTITPIVEGVVNVTLSILLGLRFGAVGVAWGTVFGATMAIALNLLYNMPRTRSIACDRGLYLRQGLVRPLASAVPVMLGATVAHILPGMAGWLALGAGTLISIVDVGRRINAPG